MSEPIAKQDFRAKQKAADNYLTMEFVERLRKINLNEKKIEAIIKTGLLIKIAGVLLDIYNLGRDFRIIRENDLIRGCGGDIKWMLIRGYFREYGGKRFPRIYAERYCIAETGYRSSSIQQKFEILRKIELIDTLESEHVDCEDIYLMSDLIGIMNAYYELQAHAYTKSA